MARLSGFRYREIVQRLKALGFQFDRQAAGSHKLWFNPSSPLRAILKQAGVNPDEFVNSCH